MAGKITDIRKGIALSLGVIPKLRAFDVVPDKVIVPCAVVYGPDIDYDKTFQHAPGQSSSDDYQFVVVLMTARSSVRAGQEQLDEYLVPTGPTSVKAAIEKNTDLQGMVDWIDITEVRNYGLEDVNGIPVFAAELVVKVGVTNEPDAP